MDTEEVELEDLDYILKFTERLYRIMSDICEGREISEEDYDVLKAVHRIMHEGNLPFYRIACTDAVTTTTQTDLFSDNPSVS